MYVSNIKKETLEQCLFVVQYFKNLLTYIDVGTWKFGI